MTIKYGETGPVTGLMQGARHLVASMFGLIFLSSLAGCNDAPGETAYDTLPSPLLYEIASADGTVEGWMFGTIHALPDGTRWRTPALEQVVTDADVLVVEIAAINDRAALSQTFAQLATTPGQPSLARRIPGELVPTLTTVLQRGNLASTDFGAMETWAVALTLAQATADGDPSNGADRALLSEFTGRPVRELEGAWAQLSIFDRLPEAKQRRLLADVVAQAGDADADAVGLREAWRVGDAVVLDRAGRRGILADPDLRNALLTQRNRNWVRAIVPLLEDAPRPLIAVGAAHLVGAEGLASLLQQQGYRVQRLR